MSSSEDPRMYVVAALAEQGLACPERYSSLLAQTPANRVIENLAPWCFLPDPKRASEYCSEALGRPTLPFALAIDEELIACFDTEPASNPKVIVINPWSADRSAVVQEELRDFDAWLEYADKISREVLAREQDELGED